jgi:DNA-binding CsgD family transcriptional regulator
MELSLRSPGKEMRRLASEPGRTGGCTAATSCAVHAHSDQPAEHSLAAIVAALLGAQRSGLVAVTIVAPVGGFDLAEIVGMAPDHNPPTLRDDTAAPPCTTRLRWESLTEQELRIADLVAQAMTNRQIASRLFVSPHTVNYHLRQIFRKLQINSRVQLARYTDGSRSHGQPAASSSARAGTVRAT